MKQARKILKDVYGYDKFRGAQEQVIEHLLSKKDSLVIMPTGGGKSICYQIPAMAQDGFAIVVSPLIALMEDQVSSLIQNGVKAAALNSNMSIAEQQQTFDEIDKGELKLLYVSPERVNNERFHTFIKRINVSFFAIDEAHCVSIWGNDFRSDYVELGQLKKYFPDIPLIALTATADEATREDIMNQLNIPSAKLYLSSFERDNIYLTSLPAQDRVKKIIRFILNQQGGAGIVYCLSRKGTENLANKLNLAGINASYYHAGMSSSDRSNVQRNFQNDQIQVICATIAFGMGIDKPNIRFIVHYNMPKNIESYYQEIGRAGRDGAISSTILFSNYNDFVQLSSFIEESPANETFKGVQKAKLQRMWEYASGHACRTNFILNYFGEYRYEPCGRCDNCRTPPLKFDGTVVAQKALSAIIRSGESVNIELLINVLRGSGAREVYEKKLNEIKTYGVGRDLPYLNWKSYITQMINQGLVSIDFTKGNVLCTTPASREVLKGERGIELVEFIKDRDKKATRPKSKKKMATDALYEKLREWRNDVAKKQGIPAYTVLNNKSLEELAGTKPTKLEQLWKITGIGQAKFDRYGHTIINLIRDYIVSNPAGTSIKGGTRLKTYEMFKAGQSIEDIAKEREMTVGTIASHLAQLYSEGEEVEMERLIKKEEMEEIAKQWRHLGKPKGLSELFDGLNGRYSYEKLRLGIAAGIRGDIKK